MKISFTTFTIVLSTFSACSALGGGDNKHDTTKLGMRRHIISTKRSTEAEPSPPIEKPEEQKFGINRYAPNSSDTATSRHRLEKRGYQGQGTYFQPGEGACGWYADSSQHIAALNGQQYGDMGRKSPHCGSWIRIVNRQTGASTKAQVQDACPGCGYGSLDLSPAAFDDLAPRSQGVVQIEWDYV
ncbi:hypothetical protein P389DRAFT_40981 [Cystobasidium minutum MCA 4210]|uniref:uncharacterized protein n=1 Tax=Cystobasidium minutum MCA 4210 TaxID=1397322 RepID=UPI0034CD1196|eukprot:jgi/Rhomi1/40981/CE40980_322